MMIIVLIITIVNTPKSCCFAQNNVIRASRTVGANHVERIAFDNRVEISQSSLTWHNKYSIPLPLFFFLVRTYLYYIRFALVIFVKRNDRRGRLWIVVARAVTRPRVIQSDSHNSYFVEN